MIAFEWVEIMKWSLYGRIFITAPPPVWLHNLPPLHIHIWAERDPSGLVKGYFPCDGLWYPYRFYTFRFISPPAGSRRKKLLFFLSSSFAQSCLNWGFFFSWLNLRHLSLLRETCFDETLHQHWHICAYFICHKITVLDVNLGIVVCVFYIFQISPIRVVIRPLYNCHMIWDWSVRLRAAWLSVIL